VKFLDQLRQRVLRTPASGPVGTAPLEARVAKVIDDALASAGLARADGAQGGIAAVIDDALTRAGLRGHPHDVPAAPAPTAPGDGQDSDADTGAGAADPHAHGQFLSLACTGPAGSLGYKLYLPADYRADGGAAWPLVVMLHGCTQSPDDFAAGTRMNALAERLGVLVAYPAQSTRANGSRCWNWFRPQDQARGQGEPALIAAIVAQVAAGHRVDPARVYVAGLSAGAAMAVVLGRTYPDVFAAVGVHSGLPYRAAHDVGSAFAAMQRGSAAAAHSAPEPAVPTIVFHGDRDPTVAHANGAAVIDHATGAAGGELLERLEDAGIAHGGLRYTRTIWRDRDGRSVVEDWRVHGGGHAWMGGSSVGSYTDPNGPDASAEMLRFFLQHAR
jgi:poly(hydroxyalkanoate) depolymerase family esterase